MKDEFAKATGAEGKHGVAESIPVELAQFDRMPASSHVDIDVVCGLYGCKPSTVWARLNRRELPQPRKFGRSTRWNVGDLRADLAKIPEAA